MVLKTSIEQDFLDLFYNEIECDIEGTASKLNLRILRIQNNTFDYHQLVQRLFNCVIPFAFSRQEIEKFYSQGRSGELFVNSIAKFRNYKANDGEAGELLLFCLLESHLSAPKILTKLEIKQHSDDYAKGSDGIHLLKISDDRYQLIFGESKLDANLTTSLSEAFKSISEFINRPVSNINSEIGLLSSQLCKEAFDEKVYEVIKSIVFPSAATSTVKRDNAFGIFAGFDLEVSEEEQKLSNSEFESTIRKRLSDEVSKRRNHIKKKIEEYKLFGYTFYVYVFPFIDLDENRKRIIKNIKSTQNDY